MPREIDRRDENAYVTFTLPAEALPLGAREAQGSLVDRALSIARLTTEVLGARDAQPIDFVPDPEARPDTTVHLQQVYLGIPAFNATQSVSFSGAGELRRTGARLASVPRTPVVAIQVSAEAAVQAAARHVTSPDAEDLAAMDQFGERPPGPRDGTAGFDPEMIATFPGLPTKSVVFERGPFLEPVTAHLTWFPVDLRLRLAWDILIAVSDEEGAFRVIVTADDATIVYCVQMIPSVARGNIFTLNPDAPRVMTDFPRPWASYGLPVPVDLPASPRDWTTGATTAGYSARSGIGAAGIPVNGVLVDGVAVFDPPDPAGPDQLVVNAFYGTCLAHDALYLLGFREKDGSYQDGAVNALGRPGSGVKTEVRTDPVFGTAHWWPLGRIPTLRFGPKQTTGRHTALDMTIVIHEYTHGVSTRLVGGGGSTNPLLDPQSRGMGEGWGDYMACTMTGRVAIGEWIIGSELGLRRFLYDENFPVGEANFGMLPDLGTYEIGELWCATLLEVNRRIGAALGLRTVVEGMKTLQVNPSLLDGRDALLLALDDARDAGALTVGGHEAATSGVWAAFARFGMGLNAETRGASLGGAVADDTVPD